MDTAMLSTAYDAARLATQYAAAVIEDETTTEEQETAAVFEALAWEGVLAVEGELTGDGRMIEAGALTWDISPENPAPIRCVISDVGAHAGAVTVGHILTVERRPNGIIWATGDFDSGSEFGREAARLCAEKLQDGVSVDLDSVSFEVRVAAELLEGEVEDEESATDDEGRVLLMKMDANDEIMVTTSARLRAVTQVALPAFASARIALVEAPDDTDDTLTASAAPHLPPADWFDNPRLDGLTPLVVTDDGRVYGHLATWNTCHIASPSGPGICVEPPRSPSGYAYFHTGATRTSEGMTLATGRVVLGTKHADTRASAASATQHYDDTGRAAADVRAGEDSFGIWVAGAVRPTVTEDDLRVLRASPLSGDWRTVGGALELVGALAVNVPGFPIPRPAGLVASGELSSLVASGMLAPRRVPRPGTPGALSASDLRYLKRLAERERATERQELAARVDVQRAAAQRRKVEAFASRKMKES